MTKYRAAKFHIEIQADCWGCK